MSDSKGSVKVEKNPRITHCPFCGVQFTEPLLTGTNTGCPDDGGCNGDFKVIEL